MMKLRDLKNKKHVLFSYFDTILYNNGEKEGSVDMKIFSFLMVIKIANRTIWVSWVSGNMPIILRPSFYNKNIQWFYIFNTIIIFMPFH